MSLSSRTNRWGGDDPGDGGDPDGGGAGDDGGSAGDGGGTGGPGDGGGAGDGGDAGGADGPGDAGGSGDSGDPGSGDSGGSGGPTEPDWWDSDPDFGEVGGIDSVGPDGWTALSPSADSRLIFVSSSLGNDANSGASESQAVRTLARAYELLRHEYPDWILMRRGDVWVNEDFASSLPGGLWSKSGRSGEEPMVVTAYGPLSSERPKVLTGRGHGVRAFDRSGNAIGSHLAFVGLHFEPHLRSVTDHPIGFWWMTEGSENLLIEDCYFSGYETNIILFGPDGVDFEDAIGNVRIRRSVLVDAWNAGGHSQGLFAGWVDGLLIEECLLDRNGYNDSIPGAEPTVFNRNMYLAHSRGVVTRGNIDARGASGGIQQRTGGLSEMNLSLMNPLGITFGHPENRPELVATGAIRYNVVLDSNDIGGMPRGIGISAGGLSSGVVIEQNVVTLNRSGTGVVRGIMVGSPDSRFPSGGHVVRDNVVHSWFEGDFGGDWGSRGTAFKVEEFTSDIVVSNNSFQQPSSGYIMMVPTNGTLDPTWSFGQNLYYTTNESSRQVAAGPALIGFQDWQSLSGDGGSVFGTAAFPSPDRNLVSYMSSIGDAASREVFLDLARGQRRGAWRDDLMAYPVIDYIRDGFGLSDVPRPAYAE